MVQSGVMTLNEIERAELAQLEATIEHGLQTFEDVGVALLAIRDQRLYRAEYGTFEDYCRERWGFSGRRGRLLMDAAQAVNEIKSGTIDPILPTHESQVRPLTRLAPEQQRDAWQRAVETAPDGRVTAGHVQRVVDNMTRPQRLEDSDTNEIPYQEPEPARLAVHFSSETPEHYTPREIIDAAIECMDAIDLDPCSNSHDDPNVPAALHYTKEDDGLVRSWHGRVYMNPPYGREIMTWVQKLCGEYEAGHTTEAIALVPARTDTQWWQLLRDYPVCFIQGRLKFGGLEDSAPFPSAVFYLGNNIDRFYYAFVNLGDVWQRIEPGMFGE